jgi:hypothetical protein
MKLRRAPDSIKNSKYGDAEFPDWDNFYLQTFPQKCLYLIPMVRSLYEATTEAVKVLIAQINSQSKLTKRRYKNGVATSDLSSDTINMPPNIVRLPISL